MIYDREHEMNNVFVSSRSNILMEKSQKYMCLNLIYQFVLIPKKENLRTMQE